MDIVGMRRGGSFARSWLYHGDPKRYQPMADKHAFEKDSYVSPNWTVEQLNDALEVASAVFAIFAAAIKGCVIPLSRSNTIWMR